MIRKATVADSVEIAELFRELHEIHVEIRDDIYKTADDDYFVHEVEKIFADDWKIIFVYEENSRINGYVLVNIYEVDDDISMHRKICLTEHLCVRGGHQKCGIGTKLMDYTKEYAQKENCNTIELSVWHDNYDAVDFYSMYGFTTRNLRMEMNI